MAMGDRKDCYVAAREATHTVTQKLLKLSDKPLIQAKTISRVAAGVLSRLDRRAYLRYVSEHPSLQG